MVRDHPCQAESVAPDKPHPLSSHHLQAWLRPQALEGHQVQLRREVLEGQSAEASWRRGRGEGPVSV